MFDRTWRTSVLDVASILILAGSALAQTPLGSEFTYQGRLDVAGVPLNDTADFMFSLWDAGMDGNQIADTISFAGVVVVDGLFTLDLDFGPGVFNGDELWLEIDVRSPAGGGDFTTLDPRQPLTAAPYAQTAVEALIVPGIDGHSLDAADGDPIDALYVDEDGNVGIGTTIPQARLEITGAPGSDGIMFPDGTLQTTAASGGGGWTLLGNVGTVDGVNFLGTTDDVALNLRVNNERALRIEPNAVSPNVIGGHGSNAVTSGAHGATISGGGTGSTNLVTDNFGTIGGGDDNQAGDAAGTTDDAPFATVGGGNRNTASGEESTVGGGGVNTASGVGSTIGGGGSNTSSGSSSTVGGGNTNTTSNTFSTIGGGADNTASGAQSTIAGGFANTASGLRSTVGGGSSNTASSVDSTVGGGILNTASGLESTVGGGSNNRASGEASIVPGGFTNQAGGKYSFAAGRQALVRDAAATGDQDGDEGTFVWADSTAADFVSTGPNQFLIRAAGGVGIGINAPMAALHVAENASFSNGVVLPGVRTELDATSPNVIGGHSGNAVTAGAHGATISGGGGALINLVTDDFGTIGGGDGNQAGDGAGATSDRQFATVGGGSNNTASGRNSTVGGGSHNIASSLESTVGGGDSNTASGEESTVGGGKDNVASGFRATVDGGSNNSAGGSTATIGGGRDNIAGGIESTVGGGSNNTASGARATVPGGVFNQAGGEFSFAAGRQAKVRDAVAAGDEDGDEGTFVWADSTAADFVSTGPDQFLIRAAGGVGVGINAPMAALHVAENASLPNGVVLPGLRTELNATSPNIIEGASANVVVVNAVGATISGGGSTDTLCGSTGNEPCINQVSASFGTVGGGRGNSASGWSTVGGGDINIASGGQSTIAGGDRNTASGGESTVGGGFGNNASGTQSTVGGGDRNTASGGESTVGGGDRNTASGIDSTVSGGKQNIASYDWATVGGGANKTATGLASAVGGGGGNVASAGYSTVPGGQTNVAGGNFSFAAGRRAKVRDAAASGDSDGDEGTFVWADSTDADFVSTGPNQFLIRATGGVGIGIDAPTAALHVAENASFSNGVVLPGLRTELDATSPNIIGGASTNVVGVNVVGATISGGGRVDAICGPSGDQPCINEALGTFSTIGGGFDNTASGPWTTIGGGVGNTASVDRSTVGGGASNTASGHGATVGGGYSNIASGTESTVGGGDGNTASGLESTVGGGDSNTASGFESTVGGGVSNTASGDNSTVGGGSSNIASGDDSTVGGGAGNAASGPLSTVPGGSFNQAGGDHSFAAGLRAKVRDAAATGDGNGDEGTFVWADSTDADFVSTGPNQFLIRATGGVGIGTASPSKSLQVGDDQTAGSEGMIRLSSKSGAGGPNARTWDIGVPETGTDATGIGYDFVIDDPAQGADPEMIIEWDTGNVGIGTTSPGFLLEVNGTAGKPGGGSWSSSSDRRLKKNIADLEGALDSLLALRGVTFEYKDPKAINERSGTRIGVIAQEVEQVVPDWVDFNGRGHKTVTFRGFEALAVEALRELRREKDKQIESLREKKDAEIADLITENKDIRARLERMEAMMAKVMETTRAQTGGGAR